MEPVFFSTYPYLPGPGVAPRTEFARLLLSCIANVAVIDEDLLATTWETQQ